MQAARESRPGDPQAAQAFSGADAHDTGRARSGSLATPCACCHRPLIAPASVARGLGPVCWHRHLDGVRLALVDQLDALRARVAVAPVSTLATIRAALVDLDELDDDDAPRVGGVR